MPKRRMSKRYVVRAHGGSYQVVDTKTGRVVYTDTHREYANDTARRRNRNENAYAPGRTSRQSGYVEHGWAGLHRRG